MSAAGPARSPASLYHAHSIEKPRHTTLPISHRSQTRGHSARRAGAAAALALSLLTAIGCAGPGPSEPLGGFPNPFRASGSSLPASTIFRAGPGADRYRVGETDRYRCRSAGSTDASGAWTVTSRAGDCGGDGALRRTIHLVTQADGSIAMTRLDDHEHGRQAAFQPSLVLYPASLSPQEVHRSEASLLSSEVGSSGTKAGTAISEARFLDDGRLQMMLVFRLSPVVIRRTSVWTLDESGRILREEERRTLHVGPVRLENERTLLTLDQTE